MAADDCAPDREGHLPFRRILPQLILLSMLFLLNFLSRIIFSPLLPQIEHELGFSHAVAGSFFLWISAGYFISVLSSGFISARITFRWTVAFSTMATGCSLLLLRICRTLTEIRGGLFVLGLAAGLYLPAGLSIITRMIAPPYWGRGIAVHELAPNIGFVVAPLVCSAMVGWFTWRGGLAVLGVALTGMALVYALAGKGGGERGCPPGFEILRGFLAMPRFWLMTLLFSLAICSTIGIYAMLPLLLVADQNMDAASANQLLSLSRLCAAVLPVAGGWLGDRFGNQRVMVAVLLLAGIMTVPLGLLSGFPLLVAVFLQPMVAVCFFPSGFAVLSTIGGRERGAAAVSFCIPVAFLVGGGIMPTLIGGIGDHFDLGAGFVAAGLAMSAAALLAAAVVTRNSSVMPAGGRAGF